MLKKIFRFIKTHIRQLSEPQPHAVKKTMVQEYRKHYDIHIFIETGTYLGEMVEAAKNSFEKIYSIELNKKLYQKATEKFAQNKNISIVHGDSGIVLPSLLNNINEPALFWLDGHYSGGVTSKGNINTPILKELQAILAHPIKQHVVLIDDARCFTGKDDYPSVKKLQKSIPSSMYTVKVSNDIIQISPQQ